MSKCRAAANSTASVSNLLLDDSTAQPTAKLMDSAAEEIKLWTRLVMFRKDIVYILFV